jgi:hypothetical protein
LESRQAGEPGRATSARSFTHSPSWGRSALAEGVLVRAATELRVPTVASPPAACACATAARPGTGPQAAAPGALRRGGHGPEQRRALGRPEAGP